MSPVPVTWELGIQGDVVPQGGIQPLRWLVVEMDCPLAISAAEASFLFGLKGGATSELVELHVQ